MVDVGICDNVEIIGYVGRLGLFDCWCDIFDMVDFFICSIEFGSDLIIVGVV